MRGSTALKLLTVINIQLAILLGLVLFNGFSKSKGEEVPTEDILGMEIVREQKEEEYVVSVCLQQDCVDIPSSLVVEDKRVDKAKVYQEVLERVVSYFDKFFGGRSIASSSQGQFIYWKADIRPDLENIYDRVFEAFKLGSSTTVEIELKEQPGTDGKYTSKYIEVDNSRQKLFVWENGKVIKEILLSGPKVGYEVYGVYPIIDKGIAPQAPTGSYMPYWMAFYYSKRQDSWYGLHGLIWWYDSSGNVVYEPTSNIGVRRSGGCIRMLKEDAKYLYDNFERGDLVLIHE